MYSGLAQARPELLMDYQSVNNLHFHDVERCRKLQIYALIQKPKMRRGLNYGIIDFRTNLTLMATNGLKTSDYNREMAAS